MPDNRKQKMDRAAALRCSRRQAAALARLKGLDAQTIAARATEFLRGEVAFVQETLCIGDVAARAYLALRAQAASILIAEEFSPEALASFEQVGIRDAASCIADDESGAALTCHVITTIAVEA